MARDVPLQPLPFAPSTADIITGSLYDAFDVMLLDPPVVFPKDFSNKWGTAGTEEALALFSIDDARLKDCIVAASALIWGIPMMHPEQLKVCYCILHPHCQNALVVVCVWRPQGGAGSKSRCHSHLATAP
jgi:hypothetical protein